MAECRNLSCLLDTKSFCFQFTATFLTLALLTSCSCCIGSTITLVATTTLLLIASWTITKWVQKTYYHETISSLNKAVLVTGCDSGFGNRLANRLNHHGFTVYAACLDPNGEGPQSLLKKATWPKATKLIGLDVTNDAGVTRAAEEVTASLKAEGKELWAIVNNAGLFRFACVEWGLLHDYEKVFDVNVMGVARVTRAFLPLLREAKGRVVNVASIAGRISSPGLAIYTISKHAVVAFSTALRREMLPWGVKVCTIEPAIFNTPMADRKLLADGAKKMWDETPATIKEAYGEEYFEEAVKHLVDQRGRDNPEEVVDALLDAIIAKEPQVRYKVCGADYHLIWLLSDYLPYSIMDYLSTLRSPKTKPKGATKSN